jgi:hypothetical protein
MYRVPQPPDDRRAIGWTEDRITTTRDRESRENGQRVADMFNRALYSWPAGKRGLFHIPLSHRNPNMMGTFHAFSPPPLIGRPTIMRLPELFSEPQASPTL